MTKITESNINQQLDLSAFDLTLPPTIAAQGAKADTALQPEALTPYRTASSQDAIDAGKSPATHTHDDRYYTETEVDTLLAGKQAAGSYADATHSHAIADVTGLQTALDGKQAAGSYAPATAISPSAITGTAVVENDPRLTFLQLKPQIHHTMQASAPSTIDGKTYDRYALNLIIAGSYDGEGKPKASVVMNLTPLRIEDGVVETAPANAKSIRLGTLAVADEQTLTTVGAIQAALQQFIAAKGL